MSAREGTRLLMPTHFCLEGVGVPGNRNPVQGMESGVF